MDIREIQRLHAQFAPDSMVVDLPRQIAALPGPGELSEPEMSGPIHGRLAGFAPRARHVTIALAVAVVVAMAGIGAASLYQNVRANHYAGTPASTASAATSRKANALMAAAAKPEVATHKEVDATPAHPVSAAPTLSATDFASARALGLTADQFRDSLKGPARGTPAAITGTAPGLTNEPQLAVLSPIHRVGQSREAPAQNPAMSGEVAPAQPVPAAKPVSTAQSAPQPAPAAQPPVTATHVPAPIVQAAQQAPAAAAQQPAEVVRPAHASHHHISRPRAPQNAEPNTDARPSADSRAASAEVKMF